MKETEMSKKKQIEEMAKDICRVSQNCNDVCHPISTCNALKYAERAYEAGYRKQSEVDYWKQQAFHACMNNGCLDLKIITHLLENADGHDDPTGEQGTDGLETAISYAKSKLASEIFEEIESAKVSIGDFKIKTFKIISLGKVAEQTITGDVVAFSDIAELKKKYTEGEQ